MVTVATLLTICGIVGLFYLERQPESRTSKTLWVPTIWLLNAGSRNISEWTNTGPGAFSVDRYLEGNPIDRNFQTAILALALAVLISRRERIGRILRKNIPIALFILYCLISVLWSDFPAVSFKRWTKLAGDFMMVMIIVTEPVPRAAIRQILLRTGCLLVPLSILFIRYYPEWGRHYSRWTGEVSYTGITMDKNTLGMVCLIVGVGVVWRILQTYRDRVKRRKWQRLIAQGALAGMVVWLLLTANSATSLSCFILSGGLMAVLKLSPLARRPGMVNLLVFVVLAVPFSAMFLDVGTSGLVQGIGRNSTFTGRTILWEAVLRTAEDPVLGSGYESFWLGERVEKVGAITGQHPNEAHNGYLEIYANLGWVGVVLLSIVIVTGYGHALSGFRYDQEMGALRLAYFVAALAYNFSEAGFKMTHPVWILFLWATTVVPTSRKTQMWKASREESHDADGGLSTSKRGARVGSAYLGGVAPRIITNYYQEGGSR